MTFKAYVGDSTYFDNNDIITNENYLENNESRFYILQKQQHQMKICHLNIPLMYLIHLQIRLYYEF